MRFILQENQNLKEERDELQKKVNALRCKLGEANGNKTCYMKKLTIER